VKQYQRFKIEGELRSEVSNIKRLMDIVVTEVSVIELVFLKRQRTKNNFNKKR
jgi:hypothetical protein